MPEESRIALSNTLIQAIGDYLITRPYKEVAMLISGLQQEVQTAVASAQVDARMNGLKPPVSSPEVEGELQ